MIRDGLSMVLGLLLPVATVLAQSGPESAGADSAGVEPATPSRLMIRTGPDDPALAARFADQIRWLERETGDRIPSLFFPERKSPAHGGIVLLSDEGQGPASPLAQALAEALARSGWAVLSLGLEAPSPAVKAALEQVEATGRAQAGEAAESGSVMISVTDEDLSDDARARYLRRVQGALALALTTLRQDNYQNRVVVALGLGAMPATKAAVAQGVDRVVWVTPRFYPDARNTLVPTLQGQSKLSVLDLYPSAAALPARSVDLQRAGIDGYQRQPVAVPELPEPSHGHALANRISAWLSPRPEGAPL